MKSVNKKIYFLALLVPMICTFAFILFHPPLHNSHGTSQLVSRFDSTDATQSLPQLIKGQYNNQVVSKFLFNGQETYVTTPQLPERFPCQMCHDGSLDELRKFSESSGTFAHKNILINHGGDSQLSCTNCHNEDAMDTLLDGAHHAVDYQKGFESCAQCHSVQYKEWQGGSHGKRLSGWNEPRVIKHCFDCHPPHDPSFHKNYLMEQTKKRQIDKKGAKNEK